MLKRLFLFEQSYVFLSPFNTFCLLFTFVGEVNTVVMHDCMTFRQHAHTSLSWTEARPKVSAKMFLHDLFPSATNSWCAHYWWECWCAHRLTHHNFWDLTCSKDWVLVKVAEVVGNAVCRFVGSSVFRSCNFDGNIEPFFGVLEWLITGSIRDSNEGWCIIPLINYI